MMSKTLNLLNAYAMSQLGIGGPSSHRKRCGAAKTPRNRLGDVQTRRVPGSVRIKREFGNRAGAISEVAFVPSQALAGVEASTS